MINTPSKAETASLIAHTLVDEVVYLDEVDSTNNFGKTMEGQSSVLLLCGRQTSGRGRGDNQWQAPEGTISFSLRVNAQALRIEQKDWPLISLLTAAALARTLNAYTPPDCVTLKWPNDVMLQGRKTAGILLEASADKSAVVIGIGLNFSNDVSALQGVLDQPATSLAAEALPNGLPNPMALLASFLKEWEAVVERVINQDVAIDELWSCFGSLHNKPVSLTVAGEEKLGVCLGLDVDGALLLKTSSGVERCYTGTGLRVLS